MIPNWYRFIFNVYGEFPAIFFLLFSVILYWDFLNSGGYLRLILSGVLLAFSVETKTLMLIAAFPYLMVIVYYDWRNKRLSLRKYILLAASIILPFLLFRIYLITSLGWDDFYLKQVGYLKFLKYGSLVVGNKPGFINKIVESFKRLTMTTGGITILSIIVSASIASLREIFDKKIKISFLVQFLSISVLMIAFWYFFINRSNEFRHLIPLVVLSLVMTISFFAQIFTRIRYSRPLIVLIALILLISNKSTLISNTINMSSNLKRELINEERLAKFVRNSENLKFQYIGWFQVPDISFKSGRSFCDINQDNCHQKGAKRSNIIFTNDEYSENRNDYLYYFRYKCSKELYRHENDVVCEDFLNGYSDDEFRYLMEKEAVVCDEIYFKEFGTGKCDRQIKYGNYHNYGAVDYVMIAQDFATWIKNDYEHNSLVINGYVPEGLKGQKLKYYIDDKLIKEVTLDKDKINFTHVITKSSDVNKSIFKLRIISSKSIKPIYFRGLGYDFRNISLAVNSISQID